jgi:hypothetical protein
MDAIRHKHGLPVDDSGLGDWLAIQKINRSASSKAVGR